MRTIAEVKWIKIVTDIFDDEKILLIESMPEADAIIVIWFKLLTLAGKQNNDGVFLMSNRIPYTDEMLATIFRRNLNTVRLALRSLEQFGMIEIVDNVITIPNWNKHQTLDAYEKKKERDRLYQQERRAAQRALIGQVSSDKSSDKSSDVAISDKDKDKEEDREEDKKIYIDVVAYLNEKAGTKYRASSEKTKEKIRARVAEGYTLEDFKTVIDNKCADWLNTDYAKFLRPETLFGTKFEGYLNEKSKKKQNPVMHSNMNDLDDLF